MYFVKFIIVVAVITWHTADAEIYKCKSPDGKTSYSENPCANDLTENSKLSESVSHGVTTDNEAIRRLSSSKSVAETTPLIDSKPKNSKISELEKKAEQGDAKAQRDLSLAYEFGYDVHKDEKKSISWLRKAAETNPDAMVDLAMKYFYSQNGLNEDAIQVDLLLNQAAEKGSQKAAYFLKALPRENVLDRKTGQITQRLITPKYANKLLDMAKQAR